MNPTLYFDFMNKNGKKESLLFQDPTDIIIATSVEEVIPSLEKVQEAVDNGKYAAGYMSYEAAPAFEQAFQVNKDAKIPLLWFAIFDHPTETNAPNTSTYYTSNWTTQTDRSEYNQSIDQIKEHIRQGDTYQVNYTTRLSSTFRGDPFGYYKQLADSQSANYSAFLNTGDYSIVSASPELFFHVDHDKITTKPMKGTVGRGKTAEEDDQNAQWLYESEKNRAENVMIVDLLRNDLGRIAKPGTVRVPELFTIEKYPTILQMTSTVTAEVEQGTKIHDIFQALFPCGSITGAPKVSTMNIINQLETSPREIYCGTIGYITPNKEAIFNVPIRTVLIDNQTGDAQYGVGGGITWDSTNEEEYEEMRTKAKILSEKNEDFQLLETLGLNNGNYIVLDQHLNRLQKSAVYFHFPVDIVKVRKMLLDLAKKYPRDFWRVRLLVSNNGKVETEIKEYAGSPDSVNVCLSKTPIENKDIYLYHKTTNRKMYTDRLKEAPDMFDVLLWNEDEEVTEFTMGNLVVELGNNLYTPPVACGLLAGTYREQLLQDGVITERRINVHELMECSRIWLINSVREWVSVRLH
ncbi:para-aminobenzoate synthetase / 4-amino-4-deoxychorismate lyase [Oceanobacillus limi]|uniref:Para-aminobenzoate synthetase / 4-amino-4-deoxychorismate lyase n=1 Tax=Oceanobacillus limi TaxID=930131 RepID=A0A1I0GKJ3_9BACI|nr:para-aminobenzoate synthetase / 4-amino-4-deoxychorismate lyase [Oceanobacillus limi]